MKRILIIEDSRNLAIKVETCVRADAGEKQRLGRWLSDFAVALKQHLRGHVRLSDLAGFQNGPTEQPQHVPFPCAQGLDQGRPLLRGFPPEALQSSCVAGD